MQLATVGIGSLDNRAIRIRQLREATASIVGSGDGIGLTGKGQRFVLQPTVRIVGHGHGIGVATTDGGQHATQVIKSKGIAIGNGTGRTIGLRAIVSRRDGSGHGMVEGHGIALLVLAADHPPGRIIGKLHFAISRITRVPARVIGIGFFGLAAVKGSGLFCEELALGVLRTKVS